MPERVRNLYRRNQVEPAESYYTYGAGPEMAFFNRVPVAEEDAPYYEDPVTGEIVWTDQQAQEQPSVAAEVTALAAPMAGGYVGRKVGGYVDQGQTTGQAFSSVATDIGDGVQSIFTKPAPATKTVAPKATGASGSGNVARSAASGLSDVSGKSSASFGDRLGSASNLYGAAGVGLGSALGGIVMGQEPKKAIASGLGSAAGYALGNAVFPGIGGMVGGALGGAVTGRVICTELYRQRLIAFDLLRCEYQHTRQHISDTTLRGYWFWSIPYTHLMRRSPLATRAILPIARARAKEIAFVLGERDRPHWGGRIVRVTMEPLCWLIGRTLETIERIKPCLAM